MPDLDFYPSADSPDVDDTLGGRLSLARDMSGLGLAELAQRIGAKSMTLKAWESDRAAPDLARLTALSRALSVSPMWLHCGVGEGPANADDQTSARTGAIKPSRCR